MFKEDKNIISKADVLDFLRPRLKKAVVEEVMTVTTGEFREHRDVVSGTVSSHFSDAGIPYIVVRSSSRNEDSMVTSNAGHFDSVLHVPSGDAKQIEYAVDHVMNSYMNDGKEYSGFLSEQILIQPESENIVMAGVCFTRDIIENRPYYTINYSLDGTTDAVTSGRDALSVNIAIDTDEESIEEPLRQVVAAVREILSLTDIDYLDIEFGVRRDKTVIIFQTRPLAAVAGKDRNVPDQLIFGARRRVHEEYAAKGHVLSDMAFWNPSEIIGDNPFPLDYSLYREIITSYIWSAGISSMGYHYVNDDLMCKLGNKPYISVDYSFEGLIPELLMPSLKKKLKNYYMTRLKADPSAHDKIEFEIVFSVFDFCTDENMDILLDYGFTKNEINMLRKSLFLITELAVRSYSEIYDEDMQSLSAMRTVRRRIREQKPMQEMNPERLTGYIGELLSSIKSDGTPQFSRMARLAFIAKSFTRTLVKKGYISSDDMELFNRSINTVASDFEKDFDRLCRGEMSRDDFNHIYGHLRLGTYNIRTDCYADMYFDTVIRQGAGVETRKQNVNYELDKEAVERALRDHELDMDADTLITFIRRTTENREYFKFEFTKSLSLILNLMIRLGEIYGISRENMSYLEIMDIFHFTEREELTGLIAERKAVHKINSCLILPEIIFSKRDIDIVHEAPSRPNFITTLVAEGDIVLLDGVSKEVDVEGKIVVITKADPGYDWIFTRNIAGFISKYGGAASHMAIRCAEFSVPAAIGCGDKLFREISGMKRARLDCAGKRIYDIL